MGLSDRKTKQRIGLDPRNLTWANDSARFGYSYLAKFGWDPSKGLGTDEAGRTSHVQVAQKLDFLGIGTHSSQDPGTAWKQNDDFEHLLKKLNEDSERDVTKNDVEQDDSERAAKRRRKTKRNGKSGTKEAKRRRRTHESELLCDEETVDGEDVLVVPLPEKALKLERTTAALCRPMAHRARVRASKDLASKSATAVDEVLGIASSKMALQIPSSNSDRTSSDGAGSGETSASISR